MTRRSRAGNKPAKARPRKVLKPERHKVPEAAAARISAIRPIADWLEKLGLGQYAQRFAENDISFSVLPDLTDQDLKDIGVSLGHRRQLLRAIFHSAKRMGGLNDSLADRSCRDRKCKFRNHRQREDVGPERCG
jgi:SAM domain (Sterile alpha motif)